jgi:glutathione S-transferase
MKLYYATGACSLAALIAAEEAGLRFELECVDIRANPHRLPDGSDFREINPKGYVPALELADGDLLTEGVAILQYIGDEWSERTMFDHYRQLEWLTFIATELHKSFSPWLFHPEYGEQAAIVASARIAERFTYLDQHLRNAEYLLGSQFGVADAYCFAIARWAPGKDIGLAEWPFLSAYLDRVQTRPKVASAIERHG